MNVNCAAFNQDYSHIAVGRLLFATKSRICLSIAGTSSGVKRFQTDPFSKLHQTHEGNITMVEMLFSTSLLAIVLSPRRLVITNTKVGLPPYKYKLPFGASPGLYLVYQMTDP